MIFQSQNPHIPTTLVAFKVDKVRYTTYMDKKAQHTYMRTHWSDRRTAVLPKPVQLASGDTIGPVEVAYETWGRLTPNKDNVVLVCHALSGDSHVANGGILPDGTIDTTGWWQRMVGPGKAIDTNKYFVICSNVIGGCSGTTGPSSERMGEALPSVRFASVVDEPEARAYRSGLIGMHVDDTRTDANKRDSIYGIDFPLITVEDMVKVQAELLEVLGISHVKAVVGGSLGGMQALMWSRMYPERMDACVAIATTWHATAQNIAFNEIGRQAILGDPHFMGGRYPLDAPPKHGLAVARMLGHVTYLSDAAMSRKFGTDMLHDAPGFRLERDFQVENYLNHQGYKFVDHFDANTYLYLTKALDYYALVDTLDEVQEVFKDTPVKYLLLSFSSDWLFPTNQIEPLAFALTRAGAKVSYSEIESDAGHDSFLLDSPEQEAIVSAFMTSLLGHNILDLQEGGIA